MSNNQIVGVCPFCNTHVVLVSSDNWNVGCLDWSVYCRECDAYTPNYLKKETAIAVWQAAIVENVRIKEKLDDTT